MRWRESWFPPLFSMPSWIKHSPKPVSRITAGFGTDCTDQQFLAYAFFQSSVPIWILCIDSFFLAAHETAVGKSSQSLQVRSFPHSHPFQRLQFFTTFTDSLQTCLYRQLLYFIIAKVKDSFFLASSLICFSHISALLNSWGFIWIYSSDPTAGA